MARKSRPAACAAGATHLPRNLDTSQDAPTFTQPRGAARHCLGAAPQSHLGSHACAAQPNPPRHCPQVPPVCPAQPALPRQRKPEAAVPATMRTFAATLAIAAAAVASATISHCDDHYDCEVRRCMPVCSLVPTAARRGAVLHCTTFVVSDTSPAHPLPALPPV